MEKRMMDVTIGGKQYVLKYDFNAVADIEEKGQIGIAEMLSEKRIGFNAIRLMFWGGMKWLNSGFTITKAGEMVSQFIQEGGDLQDFTQRMMMTINKSVTKESDETDEDGEDVGK